MSDKFYINKDREIVVGSELNKNDIITNELFTIFIDYIDRSFNGRLRSMRIDIDNYSITINKKRNLPKRDYS